MAISVGFANVGIDEPHFHTKITEIYLIARGKSVVQVEAKKIALAMGEMLVVEPGEAHTFLESSAQPDLGALIPGGGGIRKLRWAAKHRGKIGGVRIIYYWVVSQDLIYMLTTYSKMSRQTRLLRNFTF